jgi:hypothetical protein
MIKRTLLNDKFTGKQIKITKILIGNGIYKNILPGTIHTITRSPSITPNSSTGVWIKFEGEIIYLVRKEFEYYFKN